MLWQTVLGKPRNVGLSRSCYHCRQLSNLLLPSWSLSSPSTTVTDLAEAAAGLKPPSRAVLKWVSKSQRWRPAALVSCWWTAERSDCAVTSCRKGCSARREEERGLGLTGKAVLNQKWGNPAVRGSKGSQRKALGNWGHSGVPPSLWLRWQWGPSASNICLMTCGVLG